MAKAILTITDKDETGIDVNVEYFDDEGNDKGDPDKMSHLLIHSAHQALLEALLNKGAQENVTDS